MIEKSARNLCLSNLLTCRSLVHKFLRRYYYVRAESEVYTIKYLEKIDKTESGKVMKKITIEHPCMVTIG